MSWLNKNASSIEALASVVTALVAVAALIGVKLQLDAADAVQRAQSARDAYRAHLTLAIQRPELAQPENVCALLKSSNGSAYQAYVAHLLYSAEQMLAIQEDWKTTFLDELMPHKAYLCSDSAPAGETEETIALLKYFQVNNCDQRYCE